jgi:hypothetical protein
MQRFARWKSLGMLCSIGLVVLWVATWVKHRLEVDTASDEQKIARSLEIIRTSTPENRKVLKVLFYGQSITASGWHKAVVEHWHEKYPNTIFVVQNRALGGFSSQLLVRTTEQDIAAFYPDLIIFHVYGNHRAYEQIIRLFRSRTAADIIVQTDHAEILPDLPCPEGLQLTLHRQPGCSGFGWLHQRLWGDEMSYHIIPYYAKKYALALEPQRTWWRDYLLRTHVGPQLLLVDNVHPNARGKDLLATFFNQYFDNLVEHWNGEKENNIISLPPSAPHSIDGQETIDFDGSRLELFSRKALASWPTVTIDKSLPKEIDGCYQVSRATPIETAPDWPTIRRITLLHDHTPEVWTATLTKISSDQKTFEFNISGSVSGDEGTGNSTMDFVSKSGKFSIQAKDWMVEPAFVASHVPLRVPYKVQWSVNYICGDDPEVIDRGDGVKEYRYILGTGLYNRNHTVKLSFPANDLADATEFREYRPPLREN